VKDEHSRIVDTPLPGLLRDVMGVELIDYQPIYSEKQGVKFAGPLAGADAECHIWADILQPKEAEVLASYTVGNYSGKAAITSHSFGKGKAVYVGAHLEPPDLARVLRTLMAFSGVRSAIQAPQGVEVTSRRSQRERWIYLLNHTAAPQTVKAAGSHKDVLTGSTHADSVSLDPYGVCILQPT
jgi:beta-galactosidase